MDRKTILFETIIKTVFFVFSIIAAVFVVKNIISMFPLYSINKTDEIEIFDAISKTHIGKIFDNIGASSFINNEIIHKALVSFVYNVETICIIFLIITLSLLFVFFIFPKWKLIASYLKLSAVLILSYISKYLLFALCFLIFYKNTLPSFFITINVGTTLYLIICLIQLFILSLWIIKFIFNILGDIKSYTSY